MELDNILVIKDCIKDVIKIGGEWLLLLDLENLISQYLVVVVIVVVGVLDDKWGECLYVLVILKLGEMVFVEDIQ